ncbi:MAG: glycerophosphodiester phosphodiesterase family protein [Pseudomonadota bacterium]
MLRDVVLSYRRALEFRAPFLITHVFFQLVSTAVLMPLIGWLLALTLRFSDQSALTDQDIARFLMTPAGALGGLLVLSVLLGALVLDVAVMTSTIRSRRRKPLNALREGALFALGHARPILLVMGALILRVVGISLPFLAVGAGLYVTLLSAFDINYYLTARPPEFLVAVGLIGLTLAALLYVLINRLVGWALVLHLAVFRNVSVSEVFAESRSRMVGHRRRLLVLLAGWFGARALLGGLLSLSLGFGLALAPDLAEGHLQTAAIVIGALLAVSLVVTLVINALSNGALADLLNGVFDERLGETSMPVAQPVRPSFLLARGWGLGLAILGVMVVSAFGTVQAAAALSERLRSDADVVVIAHRGAAALRPENTLASVEKAIEDGADWIEIDVQESADGQVVVAHDSDFMKAAGNPLKVWDATMDDLAQIDIGSWFDPAYADQRVPLLRDVLLAAKDRANVLIELKFYGHDTDLEGRTIAIVEELGMQDQIATMSLKYPSVQEMKALRPGWPAGVLAATAIGDLTGLEGDFLAVSLAEVSPRLVARAQEAGKDIYVWTVNDAVTMSRMISMGVDGVITDDPALAARTIEDHNALPIGSRLALWLSDSFGVALDRLTGTQVAQ